MLYSPFILLVRMAASLKDVVETDEVGLDICSRIRDTVADSGLGGKVHHNLRLIVSEDLVNKGLICYISLDECKIRILFEFLQTLLLETDVVVIIHIVDSDNYRVVISLINGFHQIAADESGRSRNYYCHILSKKLFCFFVTVEAADIETACAHRPCMHDRIVDHIMGKIARRILTASVLHAVTHKIKILAEVDIERRYSPV